MPTAPKHAFKEKSTKLLILPPLRTIYFRTFQCETPCMYCKYSMYILMNANIVSKQKQFFFSYKKKEEKETHFLQEKVIIGCTSSSQKYPSMY